MKRSHAPLVWVLFGAGGMLAALLGPAMVFVSGIAVPLGWPLTSDVMAYSRVLAVAQHWWAKGLLFAIIGLFAWHAAHRIFHSLHDVGIQTGTTVKLVCYGAAVGITLVTAASLLSIAL